MIHSSAYFQDEKSNHCQNQTSASPPFPLILIDKNSGFSFLGLALIGLGTGGIKPCVSAFGGDQFALPEQEEQLRSFFSVFYFSINAGSTLSTFITPVLRQVAFSNLGFNFICHEFHPSSMGKLL